MNLKTITEVLESLCNEVKDENEINVRVGIRLNDDSIMHGRITDIKLIEEYNPVGDKKVYIDINSFYLTGDEE